MIGHIEEFDVNKTSDYCYAGKGIYLTDRLEIAMTYRTKGYRGFTPSSDLFEGLAKDRSEAIEKGFSRYKEDRRMEMRMSAHRSSDRLKGGRCQTNGG